MNRAELLPVALFLSGVCLAASVLLTLENVRAGDLGRAGLGFLVCLSAASVFMGSLRLIRAEELRDGGSQ